jgi:hypothetical protein
VSKDTSEASKKTPPPISPLPIEFSPVVKEAEDVTDKLWKLSFGCVKFNTAWKDYPIPTTAYISVGKDVPPYFSWRVGLMPFVGQELVFGEIGEATNGFFVSAKTPKKELETIEAKIKKYAEQTPAPFTLDRYKDKPGMMPFRRVAVLSQPKLMIIVETTDLSPWIKASDDITFDPEKPTPKIKGHFKGGFFAIRGDQKFWWVPDTLSGKELIAALVEGKGTTAIAEKAEERKKQLAGLGLDKAK